LATVCEKVMGECARNGCPRLMMEVGGSLDGRSCVPR